MGSAFVYTVLARHGDARLAHPAALRGEDVGSRSPQRAAQAVSVDPWDGGPAKPLVRAVRVLVAELSAPPVGLIRLEALVVQDAVVDGTVAGGVYRVAPPRHALFAQIGTKNAALPRGANALHDDVARAAHFSRAAGIRVRADATSVRIAVAVRRTARVWTGCRAGVHVAFGVRFCVVHVRVQAVLHLPLVRHAVTVAVEGAQCGGEVPPERVQHPNPVYALGLECDDDVVQSVRQVFRRCEGHHLAVGAPGERTVDFVSAQHQCEGTFRGCAVHLHVECNDDWRRHGHIDTRRRVRNDLRVVDNRHI